ncbi:hypothetical protein F5146DRAFT_609025 [Armillaria mellea]|nr:hypothetical protein F5146DRAFT_609025 [Armillaria mellea]
MKKQLEVLQCTVILVFWYKAIKHRKWVHCHPLAFAPVTVSTSTLSLDTDDALLFIGADSSAAHDSHLPALPAFAALSSTSDFCLAPLSDLQSHKWEQYAVRIVRTHQRLPHVYVLLEGFSNDEWTSRSLAPQPQFSGSELLAQWNLCQLSQGKVLPRVLTQLSHPQNISPQTRIIPKTRLLQYQRYAPIAPIYIHHHSISFPYRPP